MGENIQKPHAFVRHPAIAAVVGEEGRWPNQREAVAYLAVLRNSFKVSRYQPREVQAHQLIMWIKGYALTEEEREQGYTGNYALIAPKALDDGMVTLAAVKLPAELRYHPERKRPQQRNPDWGHGILRRVKQGTVLPDVEEAKGMLARLHAEFPETSRLLNDEKLVIFIYDKAANPRKPVQSYMLVAKAHEPEGAVITSRLNVQALRKKKVPLVAKEAEAGVGEGGAESSHTVGHFTALVEEKRKRKKRK